MAATPSQGSFQKEALPILKAKCISCHGRLQQKGGLRLDAGRLIHAGAKDGPVIKPGDSKSSALVKRISSKGEDRMPPEGSPLTEEQITTLKAWINLGAKYPADEVVASSPKEHWAFQPIRKPMLPTVKDKNWSLNPIDQFVLAKLEQRKWTPNPSATIHQLIRRLHLDLAGLPPTLVEQQLFSRSTDGDWSQLVATLLERPTYGERWARAHCGRVRRQASGAAARPSDDFSGAPPRGCGAGATGRLGAGLDCGGCIWTTAAPCRSTTSAARLPEHPCVIASAPPWGVPGSSRNSGR